MKNTCFQQVFVIWVFACQFACSVSTSQEKANLSQPPDEEATRDSIKTNKPSSASGWQIINNPNQVIASIHVMGDGPEGKIQTSLEVGCPAGTNGAISIEYIVHAAYDLKSFAFHSFEGPYAANLKRRLTEISIGKEIFTVSVAGGWGGNNESDAFFFTPGSFNRPGEVEKIAELIVNGSQVAIKVHDGHNRNNVLKSIFPSIDLTSEQAVMLGGCRR